MPSRLFIAGFTSAIAAAGSAVPAQAQDAPTAIIVFDGSGSMWNRFEGEKVAKFVTAREALKANFAKLKPEMRLGIAAFGHRRQGDCNDVQVVVTPEPVAVSVEKISGFLDKISPKGRGPLTAALKEAAKALPKDGPKSLILLHDDPDNCVPDACAALPELQAAAPGVVIHVVGLGVKSDDAQKYQCLTKPTGGRFVDGQSAATVVAGIEEVVASLTAGPMKPVVAPAPTPAIRPAAAVEALRASTPAMPQPGVRPAAPTGGSSGVRLATVLIAGQAPVPRPVHWTVRSADAARAVRPAFVGVGQDLVVPLPAGAYTVEVRDGFISLPPIKLSVPPAGIIPLDVTLEAGLIRAVVPADAPQTTALRLFEAGADNSPGKSYGTVSPRDLAVGVAIPAGKWVFRLGDGAAAIERAIDLKAGTALDLGAPWPFGRVQVTISGASTTTRQPVVVIAYEDDPDAPRGRREIARSASVTPDLVLPAGTYALVARQGSVEVRDRVAVQGGEMVQRTLTLAGARVTLSSRFPGNAQPPAEEPVAYRIERLDVVPPQVFASNRQLSEIDLPAGRYRIEARHGLVNARAVREVTLAPGQAAAVAIEQQAASIRFNGPPGAAGEHLWEILDQSGHPLWSTVQTAPRAILQAGKYIVRLDIRDKRIERLIEVRAGQVGSVDVKD